jgi:hypothetical protein
MRRCLPAVGCALAPLCASAAVAGCGGERQKPRLRAVAAPAQTPAPQPPSTRPAPHSFFARSSFWNTPTDPGAALDSSSTALVAALSAEVAAERQAKSGPWINTTSYSVPLYTVSAGQPTVAVKLDHAPDAALSAAWSAVPLPADARPAAGSDGVLAVWQPSTDRLWEFWKLTDRSDGWHASWGGAIAHVSENQGVYGAEAWPGAKPWWGVTASSLSLLGGLISLEDLKRGQIDHALAMAIPDVRAGVFASPARREDGSSTDPLSLPEGAHLRLDPSLDLQALHLPALTLEIAQAAQRYGIFITDGSANVTFQAQDPTPTHSNPYKGPGGYFQGEYPSELLASFPWSRLQVLRAN